MILEDPDEPTVRSEAAKRRLRLERGPHGWDFFDQKMGAHVTAVALPADGTRWENRSRWTLADAWYYLEEGPLEADRQRLGELRRIARQDSWVLVPVRQLNGEWLWEVRDTDEDGETTDPNRAFPNYRLLFDWLHERASRR